MRFPIFLPVILFATCAYAQVSPDGVAAGQKLFAANCSVGYCHGLEGRAGRGPRLRDREWDRNYLVKVIAGGIPNSSMPAWRGKLSDDQITAVVGYILSISKEVTGTDAAPVSPMPSRPVDSGPGKALFFDAANERNCGVCHKVGGSGGDIGPDLSRAASEPAGELFKQILTPRASSNRKPIEIVTHDGETLRGILAEESGTSLRLYDLTSPGPPVSRTIRIGDIAQRRTLDSGIAHSHIAGAYTVEQLLQIVAYLKSSPVRLEDLF